MKKFLSVGLLAVCALVLSEHQARAWVNSKFSIGLNFHQQSANTSYLWGFWRNGQIPGPEAFGPGGGVMPGYGPGAPVGGPFPLLGGVPQAPLGGQFPMMGGVPQMAPPQGTFNQGAFQQNAFMYNMPQGYPMAYPQGSFQPMYPQNLPFQTVNYQSNGYFYPVYYYGMPNYWYGSR
jgi:hypothetical protein